MDNLSPAIKHYDYIDALRGVAILLVLAVHVSQPFPYLPRLLAFLAEQGKYGVQLFFIVSALTLFLSYEQRSKKELSNTDKFFFIRRFFRIAPAFYAAIIFYTLALLAEHQFMLSSVIWPNVVLSAVFLNSLYAPAINYIPPGGWTVATEMLFYLSIPFFFKRIKSLKQAVVLFVGLAVLNEILLYSLIFLAKLLLHKTIYGGYFLYFWLPSQLPVFALGVVCYFMLKNPSLTAYFKKPYRVLALALLWASVSLWLCYKFDFLPEYLMLSVAYGLIILAMSQSRIWLFQNLLVEFFGKISFSLYLSHFFIIQMLSKFIPLGKFSPVSGFVMLYVMTAACGAAVSWIMYQLIEKPGINFGRKLIKKISQPALANPALNINAAN